MNEKLYILQNTLENVAMDYMKVAGLSHFDVVACFDSVSNTFRKMLLTKIAYEMDAEKNQKKEETSNDEDCNA